MGDIADGLITGDFDFLTGEYLGQGYGHPRSKHMNIYPKNKSDKLNAVAGLRTFIAKHTPLTGKPDEIVIRYAKEKGIYDEADMFSELCEKIQRDFGSFKDWCHSQGKP